eukprot:SAG31_NODE_1375_length_8594_cov_2.810477_3_plen_428_part_00
MSSELACMVRAVEIHLLLLAVLPHLAAGAACLDEADCSLHGECAAGICECDAGFVGQACERLNEGRTYLLWPPLADMPWSAGWGASLVYDQAHGGQWHAWVDTICQANRTAAAGMPARYVTCYHTQGTNIVHLTADKPIGPYKFSDVSLGAETNNPHVAVDVAAGKTPRYYLFHANDNKPDPMIATCTGETGTAPFRNLSNSSPCVGCPPGGSIGVAAADSPYGPWSTMFPFVGKNVPGSQTGVLTNPSPLRLSNGTWMMAYRYGKGVVHGASEAIAVATAQNAVGPWSIIAADITPLDVEDPTLYKTKRGFHIAAHQYNGSWLLPNGRHIKLDYGDPRMASGAHLFSRDGINWTTSAYALYNNSVTWSNGSRTALNYRERPELIQDANGTPLFLVSGAEWGHKCQYPTCKVGQSCQSMAIITEILK